MTGTPAVTPCVVVGLAAFMPTVAFAGAANASGTVL